MNSQQLWPKSPKLWLLLGLLLFLPWPLRAADWDSQPPLTQSGVDIWAGADGLPHFRIRALLQTRDGYLWLGTANGLVRFNGIDFTTFDTSNSSLKDNEVSALVEDHTGSLWIGTYGGGLARLKDGALTTYTVTNGLPNDTIRRLDLDRDGNLWMATPSGVVRYANGVFTAFTTLDGLADSFITGICARSSQGIFAVAGGQLYRFAGGRFVTEPGVIEEGDGRLDSITSGKDGALWLTFESDHVKCWQPGRLTTYTRRDHEHDRIGAVYADPQGTVWLAARDGLIRFAGGKFESLKTTEARAGLGLILSLLTDREGNLWLGTEATGLARLRSLPVRIFTMEDGLPENSTRCIYRDRQGDIWIGTYLGYARLSQGKITAFTQLGTNAISAVTAISEDADGRLWVGASGLLYVRQNEQLVPVPG